MNKHGRVIEIRGFKGILAAIFIVCCLVTGFTVFPGFVAMHIWNFFVPYVMNMPAMHLGHGVMLWAIVFLIWFAFFGKMPSLHFGCRSQMDDEEIREFVAKMRKEQAELLKNPDDEQLNDKEDQ